MCGICGYISRTVIGREQLSRMNDTMKHRGPNDAGVELFEAAGGYTVGLAQRRLSIQDLSPLGHQPMASADGRLEVVFNGEIYNFLELKKELSEYPYRSSCDTEVILAAYLRWGIGMVDHLGGMFAIALFDRQEQAVYFLRDRIGKKPLYYTFYNGGLVFGSELKPLMAAPGFPRELRRDVLPRYLYQGYINAPDTIFAHTYKLEPGCWMKVALTGAAAKSGLSEASAELHRYWNVAEVYHAKSADPVEDYGEAKEGLRAELRHAVSERMIADVPLGAFLSGGYDSSLVSAVAQELAMEQTGRPLKTFCIGFDDPAYDESPFAEKVAAHLGTDHTTMKIGEKDMLDLVESIPQYFDEPFADSSEIPTMLVSSLARKQVTVALSGDGGDEFFCGYNIYAKLHEAQRLDVLGAAAHAVGKIGGLGRYYPFRVRVIAENRDPETKTQLLSGNYVSRAYRMCGVSGADAQNGAGACGGQEQTGSRCGVSRADVQNGVGVRELQGKTGSRCGVTAPLVQPGGQAVLPAGYPIESRYGVKDWQIRRMLLDMDTYLPGDILCKVDRASMKYALETRCPILDPEVMEYSFRIPHRFKYDGKDKKHILKDLARDYIPGELLDRPKKGFSVPLDKWLRGPLRAQLLDFAREERLRAQGLFDAAYTYAFVAQYLETGDRGAMSGENYSKLVWSFFVFQQWYEMYLEGAARSEG